MTQKIRWKIPLASTCILKYTHLHTCKHTHACSHTSTHTCMFTHLHTDICTHTYTHAHILIHRLACTNKNFRELSGFLKCCISIFIFIFSTFPYLCVCVGVHTRGHVLVEVREKLLPLIKFWGSNSGLCLSSLSNKYLNPLCHVGLV